jgi:iron complex outermembrane receptor protein
MNNKSFRTLSALAVAIATASSGAHAAQLEEIIVTAQKRAESLQDVPISMVAIEGSKIEDAGIHSLTGLSEFVPNLGVSENAVNTIISMRGIGVGANQSFEQSVGVYVDGIHYGKSRQVRTGLFDLAQVEVLRGPQGILFGKNTLAGAINVTSASAEVGQETSGKFNISRESHGGQIMDAAVSASLSDTLAIRIAARDRTDDGYMSNGYAATGISAMPTTDERMWRISATWEPTENTTVKIKHGQSDYVRLGSTAVITTLAGLPNIEQSNALMYAVMGTYHPIVGANAAAGVVDPYRDAISLGGCALRESLGRKACENGERPEGTDTQTSDTSMNINIDLANGYTLTSVTGNSGYEYEDGIDADFLPVRFIGRSDISDYNQTSQEFRLASPVDQRFSYVTGAYWQTQTQEIDRTVIVDGTLGVPGFMSAVTGCTSFLNVPAAALPPGYFCIDGATSFDQAGRIVNWKQETDSWAVFFQGKYDLTDTLSVTAGLRYTEEDKEAVATTDLTASATGLATPSLNGALAAINAGAFGVWAHAFDESRSTDQLMPAVNLQWQRSEDSKFYVSYSEGFKSGGFNSVGDQNPAFAADGTVLRTTPGVGFEYDDETASSFEVGGKHTLLDGAMNINWAVFDSTYKNQQVSTFVGLGFVVANAASSTVQGIEVEALWQATDNLRLGANLALLDSRYDSFDAAGCTAVQASALLGLARAAGHINPATGQPTNLLKRSDPVTSALGCSAIFKGDDEQGGSAQDISGGQQGADFGGSLTADYSKAINADMMWFAAVDYNFTDGYYMTGDLDPIDYQDGFEKLNVRFGLRGDNWDIMVYGKNVTDEITASGAADVPLASGSHFRYMAPGSTWGARFGYSF